MGDPVIIARERLALSIAAVFLGAVLPACSGGGSKDASPSEGATGSPPDSARAAETPVRAALAEPGTLDVVVTAPGRTEAARQDRIRAPFASRIVSLSISDGDRVGSDQVVGEVVAKTSEAALRGAEAMMRAARTAEDSADARRAVEIAERDRTVETLRAPSAGIVLSHDAQQGEYVDEGDVIATIAAAGSVFFRAEVAQSDLDRIRSGERATLDFPASGSDSISAVVASVLPSASAQSLSAPVRLDFAPPRPEILVGLFGRARIVVSERQGVIVVPAAAVLRDDIAGTTRIAVVDAASKAHWADVRTGVRQGDRVEVSGAGIHAGDRVIVQGQVGLPEGTPVQVRQ